MCKLLRDEGWEVDWEGATWTSNLKEEVLTGKVVTVDDNIIKHSERNKGYKLLGTMITCDNSFSVEINHSIKKAWSAFHARRSLMCCKASPLRSRLRLLDAVVGRVLFWSAGTWNLTQHQNSKIRGVQRQMITRMLNKRPCVGEHMEFFMARLNKCVTALMEKHNVDPWDVSGRRTMIQLAGHIHRMCDWPPDRSTLAVLNFRNRKYLLNLEKLHGSQMHAHRLHVWLWESQVYRFFEHRSEGHWQEAELSKRTSFCLIHVIADWSLKGPSRV